MASSLAHELNQPLCAILSCSDLCLQSSRQGIKNLEQFNENLETIATQAELAGNIIRRTRGFVKKQDSHLEPVDINNLIRETLNFMDADIRHSGIKVSLELSEQGPKVMADPIQIEQVLLNLLRNATEAMSDIDVEKRSLTIHASADSNNSIKVMIRDSGHGLTPEVKEQLFNPFFSTKSDGLGIGLSISHSIIEAHKGEIWAKSNSDCGSTFGFTLPVIQT
jgi:C4-dicarboxylate-specific signal transduction histidine kinase